MKLVHDPLSGTKKPDWFVAVDFHIAQTKQILVSPRAEHSTGGFYEWKKEPNQNNNGFELNCCLSD